MCGLSNLLPLQLVPGNTAGSIDDTNVSIRVGGYIILSNLEN